MELNLSYTKIYTVLFSIFYISGLCATFFYHEILFSAIVLFILILFTCFKIFSFKRIVVLYFIFFMGVFFAKNSLNIDTTLENITANSVTLNGQIVSSKDISNKNNRIRFYLKVNEATIQNYNYKNLNSKVLIYINSRGNFEKDILIGDYITIKGKLRPTKNAKNPHQFDYKNYLLNNDCVNILYSEKDNFTKIKEPKISINNINDSWYFLLKKFEITRNKIITKHSKYIKSPELEILGGIVFGSETINPDEKIKENFRNSGLLHLLAASGLNVALIFGIWWWFSSLSRFPYNLSILIGSVFVILYTFMTGFPPSILRASIMLLFILFGKIIDRNANSIALIFFVGFLILLFSPKMLFDVGFQLSFIVTIGLIVSMPIITAKVLNKDKKFKEKYKSCAKWKKYLIYLFSPVNITSIICVPLVAQLFVMPLQIHYFNTITPFGIFANIAVVFFIGILSFIGFLSSIIALIPYFSDITLFVFDSIAKPLLTLLIKISEFFASFKYSIISVCGLNIFQMFNIWIILFIILLNISTSFKNKKHVIALLISIFVFAISFVNLSILKGNLEIIMFDVENADSFLIKTPKNKYFMIDSGRKPYNGLSSGEIIINKYLKNERIKNIKTFIITHFDSDHAGGALDVVKENKVSEIIIQKDEAKSKLSADILNYLKENNCNYKIAKNNEIIYSEKDLTIRTFSPKVKQKLNGDKLDNETSIITLLTYKNKNFLFMGDAGIIGFNAIKKDLPAKIDILKIGHHGARNVINENILNKYNISYALISTGANKFNHPHYETINLLSKKNIKTISTKNYGFTKIVINKKLKHKFYHFDCDRKNLQTVFFNKENEIPFSKSKYVQDFILNNL